MTEVTIQNTPNEVYILEGNSAVSVDNSTVKTVILEVAGIQGATGGAGAYVSLAVDKVLTAAETATTYDNEDAIALLNIDLPTLANGLKYSFIVTNAFGFQINATGGATIDSAGNVSAPDGWIKSVQIGSTLTILGTPNGWIITAATRNWIVE